MKKFALYILAAVACLTSCQGNEFDLDEDMKSLTEQLAKNYVNHLHSLVLELNDPDTLDYYYGRRKVVTISLNDTLRYDYKETTYKQDRKKSDSLCVSYSLLQIRDSIVVNVEGYIYSKKYKAHVFTMGPIINYDGIFHVDFYELDKSQPWSWGEVTYSKHPKYKFSTKTYIGWY